MSTWSAAESSVGGRGSAFCVLVENVEFGRGEGGDEGVLMVAVPVVRGLRVVALSDTGAGRWRLRMVVAAGMGFCSTAWTVVGSGGGGEGGGECW